MFYQRDEPTKKHTAIKFGFSINTDWQIEIQFAGNRNDYFGGSYSLFLCLCVCRSLPVSVDIWKCADFPFLVHYTYINVDMYVCKCTPNLRMGLVETGTRAPNKDQTTTDEFVLRFCNWRTGWQNVSLTLDIGLWILIHFCAHNQMPFVHLCIRIECG